MSVREVTNKGFRDFNQLEKLEAEKAVLSVCLHLGLFLSFFASLSISLLDLTGLHLDGPSEPYWALLVLTGPY